MTKREKLRAIFEELKLGTLLCVAEKRVCPNGKTLYLQGLSLSCDWCGSWRNSFIRVRHYGGWAVHATLSELERTLEDYNLDDVMSREEFEKKSGEKFFCWAL